jgi:hypothetical protein
MTLRPDLLLLPLDDDLVAFSAEAQRLVALNASAAVCARKLQAGASNEDVAQWLTTEGIAPPEDAAAWVTATLDALRYHGLLAGIEPAIQTSAQEIFERHHAIATAGMPDYTPVDAKAEQHYRLLDSSFTIRFGHFAQVRLIDAVIGHLKTDMVSPGATLIEIHAVQLEKNGHIRCDIYRDTKPVGFARRLSEMAPLVKGAVWQTAVQNHDYRFYIHAGVVGTGETCILLPAAPGSGKSSLTAALTSKGFRYFSDEVALLEPRTFKVSPVPLAFCVKNTGWDVIARYYPQIHELPTHLRMDGKVVRYIPPPADRVQRTAASVSHIVFPRYDKDAKTELRAIPRSEALRRLMEECMGLGETLTADNVRELVDWIREIDCFSLEFCSVEQAAELLIEATAAL